MEERKLSQLNRTLLIGIGVCGLIIVFVFQKVNYFHFLFGESRQLNLIFIFNRTLRLIVNDAMCLLLIKGFFYEKKYLKVAFVVFAFELLIMLPIYLLIKLHFEGDSEISSPLLSQVHRLIVNPMLMIILMVGFYYQKYWSKRNE